MNLTDIQTRLHALANPAQAKILQGFFKTGPGEYGEGDVFLGIKVPQLRALAKTLRGTPLPVIENLLQDEVHEQRVLALLLLMDYYARGDSAAQSSAYHLYLDRTAYINNWDLVDISAPHIVGHYLAERPRAPLYNLVQSESLWERRIAIIATFHFIRLNQFDDTLRLSEQLLGDNHDLIHKAVGWMLREVGKRDQTVEEAFLLPRYRSMPRTMLRYAIERFPEPRRKGYLLGQI
ncbi:MAG: DNA alkylation repair protein [Pseudomonadota bacterium]